MPETVAWIILAVGLTIGLVPIVLTLRFERELRRLLQQKFPMPRGRVAAIVPCKGIDQGFRQNIESFLAQDHPQLQLIFVVATQDDPAHQELGNILSVHSGGTVAALHVAGIDNQRAQKLTNQLHGLAQVSEDTDFLVFLDSDLRPDPGFIRRLIAPLSDSSIGATTGFRWYHPTTTNLGSILRSTWNAGALPLLTSPATVFAFGGAMAMRKSDFLAAGIDEAWDRALSDDFPLTLGVRQLGLELRFVPSCIAVSFEHSTLADTVEFTNRQSIISRIYFPPLWIGAAAAHSISALILALGVVGATLWLTHGGTANLVLSGCLAILPLQCINAAVMLRAVPQILPQIADQLKALRVHYVLSAPLATVLSLLNTSYSVTTRQIVWRGIRYEMVSPNETRVISDE